VHRRHIAIAIFCFSIGLSGQRPATAQGTGATTRLTIDLQVYASLPITGEPGGENTRGLLARVSFLRDEPGGRRFFVNDLNGPLYILDKKSRQFTRYLDFNGLGGRPGLFPKFTFERNFATGLTNFLFDPDYPRNGIFYTLHMEDPATAGDATPKSGANQRVDFSRYRVTPAIRTPTLNGRIDRHMVLVEWQDRDPSNSTFEGAAREILRLEQPLPQHPLGEMTFNPAAKRGDPDWRVMYLGSGDSGSGEQRDVRRLNPQRLDTLTGKILRIIPDPGEHRGTSQLSEGGQYRIPDDNPFVKLAGARPEIWAYGLRNPHRLVWDIDAAQPDNPRLLAFHIGFLTAETVVPIHRGANYGWPHREGTQAMSAEGAFPLPATDQIPIQVTGSVTAGAVTPIYPVLQYPHRAADGGDAIANGFFYRGRSVPELKGKFIFGDITSGRLWYANAGELRAADDNNATTLAALNDIERGLRSQVEAMYRARGGKANPLPGRAQISGAGRVDLRFAEDADGELYLLTKSDGMIRKLIGARVSTRAPEAEPIPASANAAGRRAYERFCASCHGPKGQGAVKAGTPVSIVEESGGKQPPDLTDDSWDHGSTDAAVFKVIKQGVPATMMPPWEGALDDQTIWNVVHYLRTLQTNN
jgi:mono/diheme cytochrome c family protein